MSLQALYRRSSDRTQTLMRNACALRIRSISTHATDAVATAEGFAWGDA